MVSQRAWHAVKAGKMAVVIKVPVGVAPMGLVQPLQDAKTMSAALTSKRQRRTNQGILGRPWSRWCSRCKKRRQ